MKKEIHENISSMLTFCVRILVCVSVPFPSRIYVIVIVCVFFFFFVRNPTWARLLHEFFFQSQRVCHVQHCICQQKTMLLLLQVAQLCRDAVEEVSSLLKTTAEADTGVERLKQLVQVSVCVCVYEYRNTCDCWCGFVIIWRRRRCVWEGGRERERERERERGKGKAERDRERKKRRGVGVEGVRLKFVCISKTCFRISFFSSPPLRQWCLACPASQLSRLTSSWNASTTLITVQSPSWTLPQQPQVSWMWHTVVLFIAR